MAKPKMKIVVVKTFDNSFQAYLIKGKLESEGIECFLTNENLTTLIPNFTNLLDMGIGLMVSEEDYPKAREIINDQKTEKVADNVCPNCNSKNIRRKYGKSNIPKWIVLVMSLILYLPLVNKKFRYICRDCKTEFAQNNY